MDKFIKLQGRDGAEYELKLRSSAGSLIHYKRQFKSDALADLMKLESGEDYDSETLCRFLWAFAYSYDKSLPPLEEWLDGFDIAPIDFITQITSPIIELVGTNIESETSKKKAL